MVSAWAAVHLLLEHARAEEGARQADAAPPEGSRWLEMPAAAAVGAGVAGVAMALGMEDLGPEVRQPYAFTHTRASADPPTVQ